MTRSAGMRLLTAALVVAGALYLVWRANIETQRANLFVGMIIAFVTSLYAMVTVEILAQNRDATKAAIQSAKVMEQSLRFSYAAKLSFSTLVVKDPTSVGIDPYSAIENDDYRTAVKEFAGSGQQMEFVFAVVRNIGKGSATNIDLRAVYRITESASINKTAIMDKSGRVDILPADKAITLAVYGSRAPTSADKVQLVEVSISHSDSYRDAIGEAPTRTSVSAKDAKVEIDGDCVLQIT